MPIPRFNQTSSLQAQLEASYAADLQGIEEDYEVLTGQADEHYKSQLDAIAEIRKRAIKRLDEKYQLKGGMTQDSPPQDGNADNKEASGGM